jgi:hypothetical protein
LSQEQPSKTAKPKDPVFKRLIQAYFEEEHLTDIFTVTPGVQVGQLQLEIDVTITANELLDEPELQTKLVNTPFWFFKRHNLLEFKSITDPLNENDFARIGARALLAWANRPSEITGSEVVSCIVSAAWPREFLKQVQPGGRRFKRLQPGLYYHPGLLVPIYLIVCNQLPVAEANYPLLVFSSGEKLKTFLKQFAVDTQMEMYLNYIAHLHPEVAAELLRERNFMTKTQEEKIMKILLDKFGPEKLLEAYGSDRLIEALGPEKYLELVSSDQIIKTLGHKRYLELIGKALNNIKKEFTPEELEQLRRDLE